MCNPMDPLNVQEDENLEETDPDLSDADTEEPEKMILNATSVSALDMILKSLRKLSVFLSDLLVNFVQEVQHNASGDASVLPQDMLHSFLLEKLSLIHPLEPNGVLALFHNILKLLPRWNLHFEVNAVVEKVCNSCKTDMENSDEHYCGMVVRANALREFKATLKWENNETEEEIFDTASVLATEIDISVIFRYEGDSLSTKYRLVSMVWSHGDLYNCVAYEKNRWVRHYYSEIEEIGEWVEVLSIFRKLHIRPEILFFENAMKRDLMFSALGSED